MRKFLRQIIIATGLVFGIVLLAVVCSRGRWLMGWDNLLIEMNPRLGLERSFFGAWQEYFGLGTPSLMAQASDLPRAIIYWLLLLVVPSYLMRWILVLAMLGLGFVGMHRLLEEERLQKNVSLKKWMPWLGAAYYLMSFATVQTFRFPFEPFVIFYAFLPWSVWLIAKYLDTGRLPITLGLLVLMFLGSSAFYVQTIFIVYLLVVGWFLTSRVLEKRTQVAAKRAGVILSIIFLANAYWLGPVGYSTLTNAHVVVESKQNQMATPENDLSNQARGSLLDTALLRGFWVDFITNSQEDKPSLLMADWANHMQQKPIEIVGLLLFGFICFGLVIRKERSKFGLHLLGTGWLLLVLVALGRQLFVAKKIFGWLIQHVPLFDQVFRAPFTKWSVVAAFAFAWGIAHAMSLANTQTKRRGKLLTALILILTTIWMMWMGYGVQNYGFIDSKLMVTLPGEYSALNTYLASTPKQQRLAYLPAYYPWGWSQYDWNYRGSGFLWYGIEQPIMDRAFDVWSPYNEGFYQEMSTAVYAKDENSLQRVFVKYGVGFVLVDESVTTANTVKDVLFIPEINSILSKIEANEIVSDNFLHLYQLSDSPKSFVDAPNDYTVVDAKTEKVREDVVYGELGDYVQFQNTPEESSNATIGGVYYPFADVFTEQLDGVTYGDNVGVEIQRRVEAGKLVIPGMEVGMPVTLSGTMSLVGDRLTVSFEPWLTVMQLEKTLADYVVGPIGIDVDQATERLLVDMGGKTIVVNQGETASFDRVNMRVGESFGVDVADANQALALETPAFLTEPEIKCWERSTGGEIDSGVGGARRTLMVRDASACVSLRLGEFEQPGLVQIRLPYWSQENSRPHFCVVIEGQPYRCINDDVYGQTEPAIDGGVVTRWVRVQPGNTYWLDVVARPPDVVRGKAVIGYEAPLITYYPTLAHYAIGPDFWRTLMDQNTFGVDEGNLTVSINSDPLVMDWAKKGNAEAENCDLFQRGEVSKEGSVYRAWDRGSICEAIKLVGLSNHQEYVSHWVGENVSGRSTKVYLYNEASKRNDLETLLPKGEFETSFGILSWPKLDEADYTISIENRSFGREISENRLDVVDIYPVPLSWISRILVGEEDKAIVNTLQINDVRKYDTSKYKVNVSGSGLLALSQGYEKGWVAMQNYKILDHVKVNGWSNGWMVPGSGMVTIFYWPQYLEWVGLVLLVGTFSFLGFKVRQDRG